jgi:subtilisin family serine protease
MTPYECGLSRRTLLRATGLAAAGGALGVGTGIAGADSGIDRRFSNLRVREAAKVWDRGYRGRPDRTLGLTDTGVDARHPDLGPWNGVVTLIESGEVTLTTRAEVESRATETIGDAPGASGSLQPGTTVEDSQQVAETFTIPDGADFIDASLSWTPADGDTNSLSFRLDLKRDGEWFRTAHAHGETPIEFAEVDVEPGLEARYVVEHYVVSRPTDYQIDGEFGTYVEDVETLDESVVFEDVDPAAPSTAATPKTVGWYTDGSYGGFTRPLDGNGHGTHVSSIMTGSGRASAIDPDSFVSDDPQATVPAGDSYQYEIDADPGEGLYVAAYGDNIAVSIVDPDGVELAASGTPSGLFDATIAEARIGTPGPHVCRVGPSTGGVSRLESVGAGRLLEHGDIPGDRTDGDTLGVHSGVAPDMGLFGMQGLGLPTELMVGGNAEGSSVAQQLSEAFNLRSVNMSWSYVVPNSEGLLTPPYGALGDELGNADYMRRAIREMAESGVLAVAAASNSFTPAQSSVPALAHEAISVVATTPRDGTTEYTSGGTPVVDADGEADPYLKPDVTAPGGTLVNGHVAAESGSPNPRVRDRTPLGYTGKAGTSMASPYVNGLLGLLSQAMEEDAPGPIRLSEPAEAGYDDAMRLKQVVLATATETAFTAAPFHRGNQPTYDFGGPDIHEGYGRVNPDAAVDAVTRNLHDAPAEEVPIGLDVPDDSRAVAGYVRLKQGSFDVTLELNGIEGSAVPVDVQPHIDLYVYDAERPATGGEPNIVERAPGADLLPEVNVSVALEDSDIYFVVAKLVNVPGHVNGDDVRAIVSLNAEIAGNCRRRANGPDTDC